MTGPRSKLTVAFPPDLEEDLVELLLDMPQEVGGFTVISAEGHGQGFARASTREKVRGRVARRLLIVILESQRLPAVLERLRRDVQNPAVAYWVEPVSEFGRLA
ncbi:MAG TPA: DUF3240 family protein [Steroidobacteraceae bacterium]|nr:DUF3240 family protein [Steroidobacteraceae bacterium]